MMDSPVNVNPVVDSQAPEVDPTNPNFVPSNKMELMSALRALVSPVEDDDVPQVYVAIKDAVGEEEIEEKEDDEMKDSRFAEAIIRQTIRNLLKESLLSEETPAEKRARIAQQSGIKTTKAVSRDAASKTAAEKFAAAGGKTKYGPGPGAEKPVKPIAPSKSEAQEEIEDLKIQLAPVMEIIGSIPEGHFEAFEEAYQAIRIENDSLGPDDVVDSNQFSNIFKKKTGTTFKQFLNELGESLMIALGNLTGEFTTKDIQTALAADGIDVSVSMLENKIYQSALAKAVFLKQAQDRGSFPEDIERPSVSDFAEWLYGSIDLDEEPDVTDNDARYMLAVINKPEFKGPARREDIIKVGFESAADDNVWAEFMDWWNSK